MTQESIGVACLFAIGNACRHRLFDGRELRRACGDRFIERLGAAERGFIERAHKRLNDLLRSIGVRAAVMFIMSAVGVDDVEISAFGIFYPNVIVVCQREDYIIASDGGALNLAAVYLESIFAAKTDYHPFIADGRQIHRRKVVGLGDE